MSLRNNLIRLAYDNPELRSHILPLVNDRKAVSYFNLNKPNFTALAQLIGLLSESADDLMEALAGASPKDLDRSWNSQYWAIWKKHFPRDWPDKFVDGLRKWAVAAVRPFLHLQEEFENKDVLKHARQFSISELVNALEAFKATISTLQDKYEEFEPVDPEWKRYYLEAWNKAYPRGWPSFEQLTRNLRWIDHMIADFEQFDFTYGQRNRYVQAKRIAEEFILRR